MATAITSENIIKQGYLKKSVQSSDPIPSTSKLIAKNIKQKLEPSRWYVFGVRNRCPYLEFFDKEESVFSGLPIHSYNLSSFQSLSYTMGRTNTDYTFCIILADRYIELTASSRPQMVEWCRSLERNLRNLGIRSKHQKEDHQYSAFPVKKKADKPAPPEPPDNPQLESTPPLVSQLTFEESLLVNIDTNEEEKENEYEDANLIRREAHTVISDDATLPMRPPPVVPKRDVTTNEDIFVTLSDIRRASDGNSSYYNFLGQDHQVEGYEKHMFNSDSDSGDDDETVVKSEDGSGTTKEVDRKSATSNTEDEDDRITSLPLIGKLETTDEFEKSDTSEDSDFISASFWLRNRKSEKGRDTDTDVPPTVPIRFDSVNPRPVSQNQVSMDSDLLICQSEQRSVNALPRSISPTLASLGAAPIPGVSNDEDKNGFALYDFPKPTVCQKKPTHELIVVKSPSKGDKKDVFNIKCDSNDDTDDYETLVKGKHEAVNETNVPPVDEIYEATWQCSSAKQELPKSVYEPEKLVIDLPDDQCEKRPRKENDDNYMKPKLKGGRLSKLFSKKSKKDKQLPESLVVDLSQSAISCVDDTVTDGSNIYSDFPGHGAECEISLNKDDSDILKMSLCNGPNNTTNPTAPVELPKRDFRELMTNTNPKQSMTQSVHASNSDVYEDFDLSQSVKSPNHTGDKIPSPPAKSGTKKFTESVRKCDDVPIAPPRRNKKVLANGETSHSFDSSSYGIQVFGESVSPSIPQKSQTESFDGEAELPPRKVPELPPPLIPRRNVLPLDISPVSRTRSVHGGARPKTIHIAMRQKSINNPSQSSLTVMNLKQNQVDILKSEIESSGGLVKVIPKIHFLQGLALVEACEKIWISGWDVKKFPRLYDKFHVGDQLVSINDVQVSDLTFASKLVKNVKADNIEISIRRIPNARVFYILRSAEGENLGIKREGTTAEIVYLDPHGLACRHGLTNKTAALDGNGFTNWALTEVNMRPLNLFPKDQEIEYRLLAVGKDISIVVQPADFVRELRKQMKKLKGYKDYLIH